MSRRCFPLWPTGLTGQIAACVILALIVSQLVAALLAVGLLPRPVPPPPFPPETAARIALVLDMIDAAPAAERPALAAAATSNGIAVTIAAPANEVGTNPPLSSVGRGFAHMVQDHLTRPVALHLHEQGGSREERPLAIDAQMSDGAIVRVATTIRPPPNVVDVSLRSFLFYLPFVLLLLAMLTIWATRRVTAPLRAFADAAERLGNEQLATPLAERGPAELQRAARSFNRMQDQIRRFVEERTRMLAAISHDLRTPITRLRLRIETAVENEPEQRKMLQDLDRMDTMIGSALSFLRDAASSEPWETVDLASLLQAICDDFADMGHEVRYSGTVDVSLRCRPSMLSRAIVNLVENAAKFAGGVAVDLQRDDTGNAVILVDDEGPGIPDSAKERAFEAFYRLDPARNPETGGVGLGMAIAKTIVQNHGGHIELRDRQPAGLRVAITLPIMGTESGCAS